MLPLEFKKSLKIPKGGNQNPYIEGDNTMVNRKKVQKDKQRYKTHTLKLKIE